MLFRTALAAAQRFPHLAELVAESSAVFERRRAAAEAAVAAAVEGERRAGREKGPARGG